MKEMIKMNNEGKNKTTKERRRLKKNMTNERNER